MRTALLPGALLLLLLPPLPARAQTSAPPGGRGPAAAARRLAEAGDTTGAVSLLREAMAGDPDDFEATLLLGTLLARTAPTRETDYAQRVEAQRLLERAYRLDPGNPLVEVELALLLRKQQVRVDARRLLERALRSRRWDALDPRTKADALFELGRILQDELEDYVHLVFVPEERLRRGNVECPRGVTNFCLNYSDPRAFNEAFLHAARVSERPDGDLARVEAYYRDALAYDPRHPRAGRELLGLLYDQGRMDEYMAVARTLQVSAPGSPYPYLFLGLGHYREGSFREAREAFKRGIGLLPEGERRAYEDVGPLLAPGDEEVYRSLPPERRREYERILWAKSDPLYLAPENERLLEHLARVTYAELRFGAPERGLPGWRSDRGLIYIRYGPPAHVWMVRRDGEEEVPGRYVLWNYGEDLPSFIFAKTLGYRNVRFDLAANTRLVAEELRRTAPTAFESRVVRRWIPLARQVARFRGSSPELVEVAAFVGVPADSFDLAPGDSLVTAAFVFSASYRDSSALRRVLPGDTDGRVAFVFELRPGEYDMALEAYAPVRGAAARARETLRLEAFPGGRPALSDLLVARAIRPRRARPRGRRDFVVAVSRDLRFGPDEPVSLYFEVYGLTPDTAGLVRYTVEVAVEDAARRGVVARALAGLGRLLRGEAGETRIRWERAVPAAGDRVPEYLTLTLPDGRPGRYRIRVRLSEPATGREAEAAREIEIVPSPVTPP